MQCFTFLLAFLLLASGVSRPACFSSGTCSFAELSDGILGFTFIDPVPNSSPIASSAGDINNDGFSDLLISGTARGNGVGYVFFGSNETFHWQFGNIYVFWYSDGILGFRVNGESIDFMGTSSSGLGDINGDGIDDFAIGAPESRNPGIPSGRIYVIFGTKDGSMWSGGNLSVSKFVDGVHGFQLIGVASSDESLGYSPAPAGDVNGDGVDDFVFGDPRWGLYGGRTYIVFGSRDPKHWGDGTLSSSEISDGVHGVVLSATKVMQGTGGFARGGGDVNGDGIDDLVIGGGGLPTQVWVIWGTKDSSFWAKGQYDLSDFTDGQHGVNIVSANDRSSGVSVSMGDINGDGLADIIAGSAAGLPQPKVWVVFGSKDSSVWGRGTVFFDDLADGVHGFSLNPEEAGKWVGYAADSGDLNGDGIADIALSAWDNVTTGRTYVVFGSRDASRWGTGTLPLSRMRDGVKGYMLVSSTDEFQSGSSLSVAGDLNGDGIQDLIVGSTGPDGPDNQGTFVHVVFGFATKHP